MMKHLSLPISLLLAGLGTLHAQGKLMTIAPPSPDPTVVIFNYDEAGNQIFRGPTGTACNTCRSTAQAPEATLAEQVGNQIKAAPVPVRTDLHIVWDASIRDYILSIDLVPYNGSGVVKSMNVKPLSDNACTFRMGGMPYGVYYLRIHLTDGSIYTRTVTKL